MFENRKAFEEPELNIIKLLVADVITTSTSTPEDEEDNEQWGGGEF